METGRTSGGGEMIIEPSRKVGDKLEALASAYGRPHLQAVAVKDTIRHDFWYPAANPAVEAAQRREDAARAKRRNLTFRLCAYKFKSE